MNLSGEDGVFLVVSVQAVSEGYAEPAPRALESEAWVSLVCSVIQGPLEANSLLLQPQF